MSEKALLLAKQDIISIIQKQTRAKYDEARVIADKILETIDWDNSALMHKGIKWITLRYIQQNAVV